MGWKRFAVAWMSVFSLVAALVVTTPTVASADVAPVVANPGPVEFTIAGGSLALGAEAGEEPLAFDLPECPGGVPVDPDGDCVTITGSVDAAGNVVIPAAGVSFPDFELDLSELGDDFGGTLTVRIVAPRDGTGTINPATGESTLNISLLISIFGPVSGVPVIGNITLPQSCRIGGNAGFDVSFTTGESGIPGTFIGVREGVPYDQSDGSATVVSADYVVPELQNCGTALFVVAVAPILNDTLGLPFTAGRNFASLSYEVNPIVISPGPNLSVTKTADAEAYEAGETASFDITVTNQSGVDTFDPIVAVDELPAGLEYTGATGDGWDCEATGDPSEGQTVTCTFDDPLPVGDDTTVTINAEVTGAAWPGGTNTVVVNTTDNLNPDGVTASASFTVAAPDLAIAKTTDDELEVGDLVDFNIAVTNVGDRPTTGTVTVTDVMPAGLTAPEASGDDWTCDVDGDEGDEVVTCTTDAVAAPGASLPSISLSALVGVEATPSVTNTATVETAGDFNPDNDSSSVTAFVASPDAAITKVTVGDFFVGRVGTYQIDVANVGSADTVGPVVVTDVLPAGVEFRSASGDGWDCDVAVEGETEIVTCSYDDTVVPDEELPAITLEVFVTPAAEGLLSNTATVATDNDPDPTNDSSTASIEVVFLIVNAGDVVVIGNGGFLVGNDTAETEALFPVCGPTGSLEPAGECATLSGESFPAGDLEFTGEVLFPAVELATPVGPMVVQLQPVGEPQGFLAPAAGELDITFDARLVVGISDNCQTDIFTVALTSGDSGPLEGVAYDSLTGRATVIAAEIPVSAFSGCEDLGLDFSPLVSDTIGAPGELAMILELGFLPAQLSPAQPLGPSVLGAVTAEDVLQAGSTETFAVSVSNTGAAATTGPVTVSTTLPAGLGFVSATGGSWTCDATGQAVTCTNPTIVPVGGALPLLEITTSVAPITAASVSVAFTVNTTGNLVPGGSVATTTASVASIKLELAKQASPAEFTAGAAGSYVLSVSNIGTGPTVDTVVVTDVLPAGLEFVSFEGTNAAWTCTEDDGAIECVTEAELGSDAALPDVVINVNVTNAAFPSVSNTATASTLFAEDVSATAVTQVLGTDVGVTKIAGPSIEAGDTGTFRIEVVNSGSFPVTDVVVTDELPAGLTVESVDADGWDCEVTEGANDTVVCALEGTGQPGTLIGDIVISVSTDEAAAGNYTNTATVVTPGDLNPTNDSSTATLTIGGSGPVVANPGEVTVTVTGGALAVGGEEFALPGCEGGVPAPGEECVTFTGTVDADGNLVVPVAGIDFPALELEPFPGLVLSLLIQPNADGIGTVNPSTGEASLLIDISIVIPLLEGAGTCEVGPIVVGLTTGTDGESTGTPYNQADGSATLVNNSFTIPAASAGCGDLGAVVNELLGLPSAAGASAAEFSVLLDPIIVAGESSDVVANPGEVTVTVTGGALAVGGEEFALPGCEGGVPAPGEECVTFTGTVDADGNLVVPVAGIDFPALELEPFPGLVLSLLIQPNADGIGTVNPSTGEASLLIDISIVIPLLEGAGTCEVGPIVVGLTTGTDGESTGTPYNQADGSATLVNNSFTIPAAAAGCGDLGAVVNELLGLPSTAGASAAEFSVLLDPIIVSGGVIPPDPTVDLRITKAAIGQLSVGNNTMYAITVRNAGNVASTAPITVTDVLPAGLDFVSVDAVNWDCDETDGTVTCVTNQSLQPQQSSLIDLVVTVGPDAIPSVSNTATVTSDDDPAGASATATSNVNFPNLAISKTSGPAVEAGEEGVFNISVTNVGTQATSGVITVTDELPASVTVDEIITEVWDCNVEGTSPQTVVCTTPEGVNAAAGATLPLITVVVLTTAESAPQVSNTATVSNASDLGTANKSSSAVLNVTAPPPPGDVVDNPGPVTVTVTAGSLKVGAEEFDLPSCPGGQPTVPGEECISFEGSVTSSGRFTVPTSGIEFPPLTIEALPGVDVDVAIIPSGPASGVIVPATGVATLNLSFSIGLSGGGGLIPDTCRVGPINVALTTGTSGSAAGTAYDQEVGTATLVDGQFFIPGAPASGPTACGPLTSTINGLIGLPALAGTNAASFSVLFDPILTGEGDAPDPGPVIPESPATDVPRNAFFAEAVDWMYFTGITTGVNNNPAIFNPSGNVNRAQMVTFLWRMMDEPNAPTSCGFTDVPANASWAEAACWAKQEGITTGLAGDPTRFGPTGQVNRAQMALFLHRTAGSKPGPTSCGVTDVAPTAVSAEAVCWLREYGITTNNPYNPQGLVNRGQMSAFMFRLAGSEPAWNTSPPSTVLF